MHRLRQPVIYPQPFSKKMNAMTLQLEIAPEFEDVRQHHDAMMELGRLELMAEQVRNGASEADGELLTSIERHMRELDQVLGSLDSMQS